MTEVLFYHLENQPLDAVLPGLVERTLARGWRAVIQAGTVERVAALDVLLWSYKDDSFLAHGTKADPEPDFQSVYLTSDASNPNGAKVRFLVDGADIPEAAAMLTYDRLVVLFDGRDSAAVAQARGAWKSVKAAGCTATYWQQSSEGRWEKKA